MRLLPRSSTTIGKELPDKLIVVFFINRNQCLQFGHASKLVKLFFYHCLKYSRLATRHTFRVFRSNRLPIICVYTVEKWIGGYL